MYTHVFASCLAIQIPTSFSAVLCREMLLRYRRFPGTRSYHDTRTLAGTSPVFNDEAVWPIARTPALEADLRNRYMAVVVFDDAQVAVLCIYSPGILLS